jgi:hypothetical protein
MRWLEELPREQQDAIRRDVDMAPPLTDRQRERLQLLFRARDGR